MSFGSGRPSTISSPLFHHLAFVHRDVSSRRRPAPRTTLRPRAVIETAHLPLVSLPNDTVPVISASMPASFGERASNSSATRGRPPVMSRVFCAFRGMRASTSPG